MVNNMFYYCHILLIASLQARKIEMFVTENKFLQSRRSLAVVAGMKKTNDHTEPTKVER